MSGTTPCGASRTSAETAEAADDLVRTEQDAVPSQRRRSSRQYPSGGTMTPPTFCTGSAMSIATVSGPSSRMASSIAVKHESSVTGRSPSAPTRRCWARGGTRAARAGRGAELRDARRRERPQRGAVVRHVAAQDLDAAGFAVGLVILAGELDRRLVGLRPGVDEEHDLEIAGSQPGDQGGGLGRRRVGGRPVRRIGELLNLPCRRLGDVGAAMPDVDAEEAGQTVEVAVAMVVPEVAAFATLDDEQLRAAPGGGPREVLAEVGPGLVAGRPRSRGGLLELVDVQVRVAIEEPLREGERVPSEGLGELRGVDHDLDHRRPAGGKAETYASRRSPGSLTRMPLAPIALAISAKSKPPTWWPMLAPTKRSS